MRKLPTEFEFREVTRPVVKIWREAKRSDKTGNIYVETRRCRDVETVHVVKAKVINIQKEKTKK